MRDCEIPFQGLPLGGMEKVRRVPSYNAKPEFAPNDGSPKGPTEISKAIFQEVQHFF